MTDHHHPESTRREPPTPKQQRYLRQLAQRTGTTFVVPKTKTEASAEIRRLQRTPTASRIEQRVADREVATAMAERAGDAVRIRESEVTGHGASARWAEGPEAPEPTDAQLGYLRRLAARTHMPMPQPKTLAEASRLIIELKRRPIVAKAV